jgi:glycosyltransferase involved in cell wall biosynthesis
MLWLGKAAPSGAMPSLEWDPFDRARLEQSNYIDQNVIAHRAGLPEARVDLSLEGSLDWDLALRLTARHAPLELPAVACLYGSYAPNRACDDPDRLKYNRIVRARVHTMRPMRVLAHNALFPLMSETYIEEEMLALEAQGAAVAFSSYEKSVSPYPVRQPVFSGGLDEGVAVHDPELVPIFTTHATMPEPAAERTVVASVSAGLPKKDWPLLLETMEQISDLDRVIVLARSNGLEHVPEEVEQMAAAQQRPPAVRINLPRAQVFELLARTSVLLYTVAPNLPLGMPMSVIEGLRAGACVVTPDRAEMRALCAEGVRPYRNAADIVAHVREIMAGGPAIEAERSRNRASARARFCDAELGRRFHAEISEALTAWRLRV